MLLQDIFLKYILYDIYIYIYAHFLIYGISIEIVIFCNYTHTNLENYSCNIMCIHLLNII